MMQLLTQFAALSMAGTMLLSLLPDGSMKRTAGMAVGLLSLLCWADGVAQLLSIELTAEFPVSVLAPTMLSLKDAASNAVAAIQEVHP